MQREVKFRKQTALCIILYICISKCTLSSMHFCVISFRNKSQEQRNYRRKKTNWTPSTFEDQFKYLIVYQYISPNLRSAKPLRELMAFAAIVLARSEILIATLMFHSAARPFASIIDVHSIRRDFKGFSCLQRENGDWRGERVQD